VARGVYGFLLADLACLHRAVRPQTLSDFGDCRAAGIAKASTKATAWRATGTNRTVFQNNASDFRTAIEKRITPDCAVIRALIGPMIG
jgi:hypothetical protein